LDLYGYENEIELIGKPALKTIVYEEDVNMMTTFLEDLKSKMIVVVPNLRRLHKNGDSINTEMYISKLIINDSLHMQLSFIDITEKLELENRLIKNKEKYKGLFNNG
jgi:PAS domain S-box-containing protein